MVGWHHRLNGCEFEPILGDGEGQGSLACCSPWGRKKLDTTEQLNNNKNNKTKGEGINNNNFYHPISCRPPLLTYSEIYMLRSQLQENGKRISFKYTTGIIKEKD